MGPRLVLAAALTAVLLVVAAALGSTGYAGNEHEEASAAQYDSKVIICHRNESSAANTLRVSTEGAKAHLRVHDDDTAGPCDD